MATLAPGLNLHLTMLLSCNKEKKANITRDNKDNFGFSRAQEPCDVYKIFFNSDSDVSIHHIRSYEYDNIEQLT